MLFVKYFENISFLVRNGEATVWKAEEEGGREGKGRRQAKVGGGGGGGWFQGKIGAADDEIG